MSKREKDLLKERFTDYVYVNPHLRTTKNGLVIEVSGYLRKRA